MAEQEPVFKLLGQSSVEPDRNIRKVRRRMRLLRVHTFFAKDVWKNVINVFSMSGRFGTPYHPYVPPQDGRPKD